MVTATLVTVMQCANWRFSRTNSVHTLCKSVRRRASARTESRPGGVCKRVALFPNRIRLTTYMAWCMVRFSIADLEAKRHVPLKRAFEKAFTASSSPKKAAMFGNKYMEASRTYYFSPAAVAICSTTLREFAATDCRAPARHMISLLAGHSGGLRVWGL